MKAKKNTTQIPRNATPLGHRVLREGEHTGHRHVAVAEGVELLRTKDNILFARVPARTTVQHEEHNPMLLPAGEHVIKAVREYDHLAEEAREVLD